MKRHTSRAPAPEESICWWGVRLGRGAGATPASGTTRAPAQSTSCAGDTFPADGEALPVGGDPLPVVVLWPRSYKTEGLGGCPAEARVLTASPTLDNAVVSLLPILSVCVGGGWGGGGGTTGVWHLQPSDPWPPPSCTPWWAPAAPAAPLGFPLSAAPVVQCLWKKNHL